MKRWHWLEENLSLFSTQDVSLSIGEGWGTVQQREVVLGLQKKGEGGLWPLCPTRWTRATARPWPSQGQEEYHQDSAPTISCRNLLLLPPRENATSTAIQNQTKHRGLILLVSVRATFFIFYEDVFKVDPSYIWAQHTKIRISLHFRRTSKCNWKALPVCWHSPHRFHHLWNSVFVEECPAWPWTEIPKIPRAHCILFPCLVSCLRNHLIKNTKVKC